MIAYLRIVAVAAVVLASAACGGEDAVPTGAQPSGDQRSAFTDCLREHGVTPAPRPSGSPSPRPSGRQGGQGGFGAMGPEAQAAMEACRSLMPSGGPGQQGNFDDSALNAFRTCMKDNGVEDVRGFQDLDQADPKVAEALEKCRALMPTRPSPGGGGTPSQSA
ncbi:hypothetical protein GCM10009555_042230 [Acrocarpospora macrocephala]|uniref:Secreted protein n=1 Tax=Acrocarpospora macrocephala TaxID=150177 RepID=A0A5M3WXN5_9ACTN|nr:hypothetical protein [Acrocarpospora macrocephala]GES13694.1 hypothetical protein Amac_072910 [Acrocarpospora macrocephala]